jgi:hypothetical protein
MFTFVNATEIVTQRLKKTNDSISLTPGYTTDDTGYDLCGKRLYKVNQTIFGEVGLSKLCTVLLISDDPPILKLQTSDPTLVGI